MPQCDFTKSDGKRCEAPSLRDGGTRCFWHRLQGENTGKPKAAKERRLPKSVKLTTAEIIRDELSRLYAALWDSSLTPTEVNAGVQVLNTSLRAVQGADLEAQIQELRKRVAAIHQGSLRAV